MSSFRFLADITFHLFDLTTPFRRARRPWHRDAIEVVRWALVVLLIGGPAFVCAITSLVGMFSRNPTGTESTIILFCNSAIAIPILLLGVMWPSLAAFLVSPLVLRQREQRSWDTVLSTPYPRRDILTGIVATSLAGFAGLLQFTLLVQIVMGVIACLHVLRLAGVGLEIMACVLMPVIFTLFALERAQETALALLLGVVVSYLARSWPVAATGAVVAGLSLRLAQLWLVVMVALLLDAGQAGAAFADTLVVGSAALMFRFSWAATILAPLGFIALRELIFRGVLAWILWHMGGE